MRKIVAIALKDTRLRFTGWSEWIFFLILPVIFTFILGGGTGAPADQRVRLVVVDLANSPLAAELLAALERSEAVRTELLSPEQAESEFSRRRVTAVLTIPAHFDLARLQGGEAALELRQLPNNTNAMVAERAVRAVSGRVGSALEIANASAEIAGEVRPFASAEARQAYIEEARQAAQTELAAAPDRIAVTAGTVEDRVAYDPRANSSAGQLITWVFIPLIALSALFAYERQQGTLRRLLTTPTGKPTFLLGAISGQVTLALVQMLLLIGFGVVVMNLDWGQSPAALAVMLISAALAAAALGTTLGVFVKTDNQAGGLSTMLGMVMALLGGCWYPIELFPPFVQNAVKVLPTTWAMQGLLDIVARGRGLVDILPEAGVLLGFAALFFAIGIWRFRYE